MAIIFNVTYLYFAKIVNIFVIPYIYLYSHTAQYNGTYAPLQYYTVSNQIFPVL